MRYKSSCDVAEMCTGDPRCEYYAKSQACQALVQREAELDAECGRRQDGVLMCRPARGCSDCPLSGMTE
jgi:hypothetical protein